MCGNSNVWGFQRRECSLMLQMPSDKARCSWKGLLSAHVGVKKCCKIGILCPLGPTKHAPNPVLTSSYLIWIALSGRFSSDLTSTGSSVKASARSADLGMPLPAFPGEHCKCCELNSADASLQETTPPARIWCGFRFQGQLCNQYWISWVQSFRHHQCNVCVSMSKKMSKELNDDMD